MYFTRDSPYKTKQGDGGDDFTDHSYWHHAKPLRDIGPTVKGWIIELSATGHDIVKRLKKRLYTTVHKVMLSTAASFMPHDYRERYGSHR